MTTTAPTALCPKWILPVVPRNRIINDCAVVIDNGKIIDICPQHDVPNRFPTASVVELNDHVLMPGLINAHGHAAMSLMRGFADDKPLMDWLEQDIWPQEKKYVNEEFVRDGTQLAIAEMLLSGTTCFSDMYFFPEVAAEVAFKAGIRAQLAFPILDFSNNWAASADDAIHKGLKLHDVYRSNDLITICFGPHAPFTVSDDIFKRITTYAAELQSPIQIHLHETREEIENSMQTHHQRPISRLHELGLMSPLTQGVHATQLDESDITILEHSGAHIVHCPRSNMKLASGTCPVTELLQRGVNVCLGTDGAASNNQLNMFNELQTAALLGKLQSVNASALDAMTCIEMATINGAKALGQEEHLGSIEIGKVADLIAVKLSSIAQQPLFQPISQLVYSDVSNQVSDVWVNGKQIVQHRALLTLNESEIIQRAQFWATVMQNDK